MNKIFLYILLLCQTLLFADDGIELAQAKEVSLVPVGSTLLKVTTPPNLLHTISLTYDAKVVQVKKPRYESVKKGEVLATISAPSFLEEQKNLIDTNMEFNFAKSEFERKSSLCKEQIIAQKECNLAKNELDKLNNKLISSKVLLKTYGTTDAMIKQITTTSTIYQNISLHSPVDGIIADSFVDLGKSTTALSTLFIIKANGNSYLEGEISKDIASNLKTLQDVSIKIDETMQKSKILLLSSIINPQNQSRFIRLSIPKNLSLIDGEMITAELSIEQKALVIPKKALAKKDGKDIVFIKNNDSFLDEEIELLHEDKNLCYIKYDSKLFQKDLAITQVNLLQNRLQESKDE